MTPVARYAAAPGQQTGCVAGVVAGARAAAAVAGSRWWSAAMRQQSPRRARSAWLMVRHGSRSGVPAGLTRTPPARRRGPRATVASSRSRPHQQRDGEHPEPHRAVRRRSTTGTTPRREQQRDPAGDRHRGDRSWGPGPEPRAEARTWDVHRPRAPALSAGRAGARAWRGEGLDVVRVTKSRAGQPRPGTGRTQERGRPARADAQAQRRRPWSPARCRRRTRTSGLTCTRPTAPGRRRCPQPRDRLHPGGEDVARVEARRRGRRRISSPRRGPGPAGPPSAGSGPAWPPAAGRPPYRRGLRAATRKGRGAAARRRRRTPDPPPWPPAAPTGVLGGVR